MNVCVLLPLADECVCCCCCSRLGPWATAGLGNLSSVLWVMILKSHSTILWGALNISALRQLTRSLDDGFSYLLITFTFLKNPDLKQDSDYAFQVVVLCLLQISNIGVLTYYEEEYTLHAELSLMKCWGNLCGYSLSLSLTTVHVHITVFNKTQVARLDLHLFVLLSSS